MLHRRLFNVLARLARSMILYIPRTDFLGRVLTGTMIVIALPLQAATVEAIRSWRAPDHTRLVLDLSDETAVSSFALDNPSRFVLDLKQARLVGSLQSLSLEETPILQVRAGIRKGTDLRLVLDLSAEVRTSVFSLPPNNVTGHRIVVDLLMCWQTNRSQSPSPFCRLIP